LQSRILRAKFEKTPGIEQKKIEIQASVNFLDPVSYFVDNNAVKFRTF